MIRPSLRIASAFAGLLIIAAAATSKSELRYLTVAVSCMGGLFLLPLFASWRAPRIEEFEFLSEWVGRLRTVMVVCWGAAFYLYMSVLTAQSARTEALEQLASLGAAFWTVGLISLFFTAYFNSRRTALIREHMDNLG